jgi:polysaccharide export outer membrane protein
MLILLSMAGFATAQGPSSSTPTTTARPATGSPAGSLPAPVSQPPAPTTPAGSPTSPAGPTTSPAGSTPPIADPAAAGPKPEVHVANTAPDYRLVPGDKLRIEVYRDAQLSQSLQVRPDGKITLPLVGDVPAEGRTSAELREALVASLKDYNTNPVVTVIVVETVPPVFYVMGEVNNPGTFQIKGQISAVQALAMAGGFKDFAKTKSIKIVRKGARGVQQNLTFNYKEAAAGKGPGLYVQPGDTIIVP